MNQRRRPGEVRDAVLRAFTKPNEELTVAQIEERVIASIGEHVSGSSVRSYLNLNTPGHFLRTGRGTYRLVRK